ncbi:unnamed protein product [Schistosoma turkestanicum]|nr:unnamed protein product [Schistosoma turkestanicum]
MFNQCLNLKNYVRPIYHHINPLHPIHSHYAFLNRRNIFAVTGIQPSGKPHLGNYLGVIKPCIAYSRNNDISKFFMLIADLHALTSKNCTDLELGILELVATLLACGFEGNSLKQIIFLQSSVPGHTELAWILSTVCSILRLAHLPQWRDKCGYYNSVPESSVANNTATTTTTATTANNTTDKLSISSTSDSATVGLFTYPTLQAADILLYGAHAVPIGADQIAHIELTRDLVRSIVYKWPSLSSILHIPKSVIFDTPKINNLMNPLKKMSKSDQSEIGVIYLTDTPDSIFKKIKRAETDSIRKISYDTEKRPGVSNLLRILASVQGRKIDEILPTITNEWSKEDLKLKIADALIEELNPIQKRIHDLMNTDEGQSTLVNCLTHGAEQANQLAAKRLELIYSAIGCKIPVRKVHCTSYN